MAPLLQFAKRFSMAEFLGELPEEQKIPSPADILSNARGRMADHDYATACRIYEAYVESVPGNYVASNELGDLYSLVREHDLAITTFLKSIAVQENDYYAYYKVGMEYLFFSTSNIALAVENLLKATTLNTTDPILWYHLSVAYRDFGLANSAEHTDGKELKALRAFLNHKVKTDMYKAMAESRLRVLVKKSGLRLSTEQSE